MAGGSLLMLLDDIASILDDVAVMSKMAVKNTAGVLGDDLALNAQQVSGVQADRELPVVWAVAKGSLVNKAILVPAAIAISAFAPWALLPMLMIGGLFLCFEGFEKIVHKFLHGKQELDSEHLQHLHALADPAIDVVQVERTKIRGAIRTDFILSAEIIVISMGAVAEASLLKQTLVLVAVAIIMTIGVYGLVGGIVKMDDLGQYLLRCADVGKWNRTQKATGSLLLQMAPKLMRFLTIAGTVAMFLVGGGIVAHAIPPLHHFVENTTTAVAKLPNPAALLQYAVPLLTNGGIGLLCGAILVGLFTLAQRLWKRNPS